MPREISLDFVRSALEKVVSQVNADRRRRMAELVKHIEYDLTGSQTALGQGSAMRRGRVGALAHCQQPGRRVPSSDRLCL